MVTTLWSLADVKRFIARGGWDPKATGLYLASLRIILTQLGIYLICAHHSDWPVMRQLLPVFCSELLRFWLGLQNSTPSAPPRPGKLTA